MASTTSRRGARHDRALTGGFDETTLRGKPLADRALRASRDRSRGRRPDRRRTTRPPDRGQAHDARVARVLDGLPENAGEERALPITIETVTGNAVFLDLEDSRFGFYAHLQPGSIRVKEGDRVVRGQALARRRARAPRARQHAHLRRPLSRRQRDERHAARRSRAICSASPSSYSHRPADHEKTTAGRAVSPSSWTGIT